MENNLIHAYDVTYTDTMTGEEIYLFSIHISIDNLELINSKEYIDNIFASTEEIIKQRFTITLIPQFNDEEVLW